MSDYYVADSIIAIAACPWCTSPLLGVLVLNMSVTTQVDDLWTMATWHLLQKVSSPNPNHHHHCNQPYMAPPLLDIYYIRHMSRV